jgi:pimeloyl-ACP methyl ester carboxylesterase
MTERTVDVPGARLHVIDEGDPGDPPIVLLHAWVVDSRAWDEVAPLLVAAGYRVVRFDARGFGRTVATQVEFSHRADVIAVLDALGIGRAALVGNSGGGQMAIDTALESPSRIAALVAIGAGVGGFEGPVTPDEEVLFERADALESAEPIDVDALVDFETEIWLNGPSQPSDRTSPELQARFRTMDREIYDPPRDVGTHVRLEPRAIHRLGELEAPVLAIAGGLDFSDTVAGMRHLGASVPNGETVIWPDVAHLPGLEVPERLAARIVEFLAPLPRWS